MKIHMPVTQPTLIYIMVICLTILSAYMGEFSQWSTSSLVVVLCIMVVKAQLIIDYFMRLKHVQKIWRRTMSAFSMVIALFAFFLLR